MATLVLCGVAWGCDDEATRLSGVVGLSLRLFSTKTKIPLKMPRTLITDPKNQISEFVIHVTIDASCRSYDLTYLLRDVSCTKMFEALAM